MKTQIQTPGFNAKPSLLNLINDKIQGVNKFSDRIIGAKIILKIDKSETHQNKVCEINLSLPGHNLFAKKESQSFEEAFEHSVQALERQLKEWKSKNKIQKAELRERPDLVS